MAKPIVKTIHAFDADNDYTVEFTWSGNQAYNNRMIIYNADSLAVVYDHVYSQHYYRLNHVIPAYTLENNTKYAVQISVIDANGNASTLSDKYYFWTATTPNYYFDGLTEGETVYSPYINLTLVYSQSGTEELTWVKYFLYDASGTLVKETDTDYSCTLTYTFTGLDNKTTYYVRATGSTTHSMALDTGRVSFTTSYQNPSAYARIYAENEEDTGFVNYYSNIIVISPDEDDYTYEDGYIDLTELDPSKSIHIYTTCTPNTSMEVKWTDVYGTVTTDRVSDSNSGITITGYKWVDKILINGVTTQDHSPNFLGDYQEIETITNVDITFNRADILNLSQGMRLASLPINGKDYMTLETDGTRRHYQEVGFHLFRSSDYAVRIETDGNDFITYYDLDGKVGSVANNILCTCIPVNKTYTTSISMDAETGYVKIVWRSDKGINNEAKVQAFFAQNNVVILYPLAHAKWTVLDQVEDMPTLENIKILRYSNSLTIPGEKATFAIRMKECRVTSSFLKVYTGSKINFILSGRVYEDNTFRLILTVYGAGQRYIQYSDPLEMTMSDILTVYIRRINGIYGMYINIFENDDSTYNNMWLGDETPSDTTEDKDLWINLDQAMVRVAHDDIVVYYQPEEPSEAANTNIWIGGDL